LLDTILKRTAYRRSFFIVVLLLVVTLVLLRYLALPYFDSRIETGVAYALQRILEGLLVSLVVTIGIGSFIFWLVPDLEEIANVTVIYANEIGDQLERAMRGSDVWWFMGASGRYFRSVTLDCITAAARKGTSSCHVIALVLDPQNSDLCEKYAQYRRSLKSASNQTWTCQRVQEEVLGTLLRTLHVKDNYPQLRLELGLRSSFSTFRYDLSSSHVIITKEDPQSPGMRCAAPGYYYSAYRGEINFAFNQSKQLSGAGGCLANRTLDLAIAKEALMKSGINASVFSDPTLQAAVALANDPKNPYG
jgi:hypothetical protein